MLEFSLASQSQSRFYLLMLVDTKDTKDTFNLGVETARKNGGFSWHQKLTNESFLFRLLY
jgi:hypothetical protein